MPPMRADVLGVVLAGGASRRMGRDKAKLALDGGTLVERAATLLVTVCSNSVLAVGSDRRYPTVRLPVAEDRYPGAGPLAGIEAALVASIGRPVLVLACDLPRVDRTVLERLLEHAQAALEADGPRAWLPRRGGRLQPLCGLYAAACGPLFTRRLDRGERAVQAALTEVEVEPVCFDDLRPDPFLNVNTPADYSRAGGLAAVG